MQAKELMIGNFLTRKSCLDVVCTVNWGIIKEFELGERNEYIPIPLTEEWFKKFGFKKYNDKGDYWDLEGLKLWCDGKGYYHINSELLIHIDYVHQLQNLHFCLTEEELIRK